MKTEQDLNSLISERDKHVTRLFWTGFEIALLFAIPLAIAVVLIKFVTNGIWSWIVIILAFVLSWSLVIRKYLRLSKIMTKMDNDIRSLRAELDIPLRPEHKYPDEIEKEAEDNA